MSYNQYPSKTDLSLSVIDDKVTSDIIFTPHEAPVKVQDFLFKCGWSFQMHDPNTDEPLYVKTDEPATMHMSYRWYEAVAYESFKFMTLSDGQVE